MEKIEKYSYLWDNPSGPWVLFHTNWKEADAVPRYSIVNAEEKSAMLIEDDEVYESVKKMMLDSGVRVVWPGHGF